MYNFNYSLDGGLIYEMISDASLIERETVLSKLYGCWPPYFGDVSFIALRNHKFLQFKYFPCRGLTDEMILDEINYS